MSICLLEGIVMRVIGRRFIKGNLSPNNFEELFSQTFKGKSLFTYYSLMLFIIFVNPRLKEGTLLSYFSSFSSTICSRFNWPIMVYSGCSASEKNGLRYLFLSILFYTQNIEYDTILMKGFQSSFIFLVTSFVHLSILSSFKAAGVNRIYLNVLLSQVQLAFSILCWLAYNYSIVVMLAYFIPLWMQTIKVTSYLNTNLGADPLIVFVKLNRFQFLRIMSSYPHSLMSYSKLSKQYKICSFQQIVKPPSECPILFYCLVLRKTSSTYTMQQAQKTAQCSEKSLREMGASFQSEFFLGLPLVYILGNIQLIILLQDVCVHQQQINTQQNYQYYQEQQQKV